MTFTALLVPVPAADWLVRDRHVEGVGPVLPAHITLVTPFVPPDSLSDGLLAELSSLFGDVVPFAFRLDEVCQFPSGAVYLAPDPAAPFVRLTQALFRRFPEHSPFEGRLDDVVPHVTVPVPAGETVDDVTGLVAAHGPFSGYAQEAQLVRSDHRSLSLVETFPFGTTAA